MSLLEFQHRVATDLLPAYCANRPGYHSSGFGEDYSKLHDADMKDCLRGLDAKLLSHVGRGLYCTPRNRKGGYPFFWEGSRDTTPRPLTLWGETVIIFAALARLNLEYGWPKNLLQTESGDGAFDLSAHLTSVGSKEYIACEVKKTSAEFNHLVATMIKLGRLSPLADVPVKERNAFNKLKALRSRGAPLFWVVGPGGLNRVFRPRYEEDGRVGFEERPGEELQFSKSGAR